jgi:hypothetical protein
MNVSSVFAATVVDYVSSSSGCPSPLASQASNLKYYLAADGATSISTSKDGIWSVSTTTAGSANNKSVNNVSGGFFNSESAVYAKESKNPVLSITINTPGTLYIDWVAGGKQVLAELVKGDTTYNLGSTTTSSKVNDTGVQSQITITSNDTGTYTLQKNPSKDYYLCALAFVPTNDNTDNGDGNGEDGGEDNGTETESKVIPIGTELSYSLGSVTNTTYNDVELPAQASEHLTTYDSADGYVKMAGELSCNQREGVANAEKDNPHALLFNTAGTIKFSVEGNSTISLGLCLHNETKEQTITAEATASNATLTPASFDNDTTGNDGTAQTIIYKGGEGEITLNIPAGTYIHSLGINVTGVALSDYQGGDITVDANGIDDPENNKFTTVTNAIKAIETFYGDSCDGVTVTIKKGTYRGRIDVNTPNVTLKGESADGVIIVDNANEANQNVEKTYANTFHGDTVAVFADGFKAETLTIMNDSELDSNLGSTNTAAVYYSQESKKTTYSYTQTDDCPKEYTGNGTAFSIGNKDGMSGTATLTNVKLLATRDTVYTGKASADTAIVFDNCTIYGFQDVICGGGDATLTDCTWNVNSGKNARLFAPIADSTYKATNLTITNTKTATKSTFARAWGDGTSTVIIDGYTDSGNNIYADGATIGTDNTSIYGFETKPVTGSAKITDMLWLARESSSDVFHTTLATVDDDANAFVSATLEEDGSAYRIIGKINDALVEEITKVGFVLHGSTSGQVILSDDTAYTEDGSYYSVFFVNDNAANLAVTINPYVEYEGYAIEGKGADGESYTYTFETTVAADAE